MRTHLLHGKVRHMRVEPTRYGLEHDVFYFALDLDELDRATDRGLLVGRNRRAILAFHDDDHLPSPATDLARDIREHLRREGLDLGAGRITLITNLRVLGYVFNPASFYLCRDVAGRLAAVVVEVHNTHRERHLYTLRSERAAGFSAAMDKDFYVSPFIGPDGRYRVSVREESDGLSIGISERQEGRPLLSTSLKLNRLPLTNGNLVRLLVRHPLMTQRTIALIHWHALRLWLRGVPFNRHSPAAVPAAAAGREAQR